MFENVIFYSYGFAYYKQIMLTILTNEMNA